MISNPFKKLGNRTDDVIGQGGFGAVMARAGVGKTAILVQLALNAMLRKQNVLHISLNDPVTKVGLWYKEMFGNIAAQNDVQDNRQIWDSVLPHRFIMTFKVEGFSVPKLEERLTDLTEQNIFSPDLVIIDGLPFDDATRHALTDLKILARKHRMRIWFTITTHRHEETGKTEIAPQILPVKDLFDIVIQLQPEGKMISVFPEKDCLTDSDQFPLVFDPASMILKEKL
jgi:KaiC/GvpD/RAD55 family RecA-like ATPase